VCGGGGGQSHVTRFCMSSGAESMNGESKATAKTRKSDDDGHAVKAQRVFEKAVVRAAHLELPELHHLRVAPAGVANAETRGLRVARFVARKRKESVPVHVRRRTCECKMEKQ
jgi:hypothetical protein